MVGFGYSVGDLVSLGQLAWKIYKSCKEAPESFRNISQEVLSLHAVLKEAEETFSNQKLTTSRQSRLKTIGDGCRGVLQDLQGVVDRYNSLGTHSKRTWDRLGWGLKDITELRSRLTSNIVLLTAFISTSQIVVEQKLDVFLQEYQDGKHEGSVFSTQTVESLSTDERQTWRAIRKELEDIGISVAAFDANKTFIISWFKTAVSTGAFEERRLEDDSNSVSHEDTLGHFSENPAHASNLTSTAVDGQRPISNPKANISQKSPSRVPNFIKWLLRYDKALVEAVSNGDKVKVERLLERGADVEAIHEGFPALCQAAIGGHETIVRLLLNGGADINAKTKQERTALNLAAENGNEKIVQLLLNEGANVHVKDGAGQSVLHFAARNGHEMTVQLLLKEGAEVNAENFFRGTPLHFAAEKGHEKILQMLLNERADINAENNEGETALHIAVKKGHETIVQLLLNGKTARANVNAQTSYWETPLHVGVEKGHEKIVQMLLNEKADMNAENNERETALHIAVKKKHETILQMLLNEGADINASSILVKGMALHSAVKNGHETITQLLLNGGADVNMKYIDYDMRGYHYLRPVLHLAAQTGHVRIVQLLLNKGANFEARDRSGMTAKDVAVESGHEAVVKLLEAASQKATTPDPELVPTWRQLEWRMGNGKNRT